MSTLRTRRKDLGKLRLRSLNTECHGSGAGGRVPMELYSDIWCYIRNVEGTHETGSGGAKGSWRLQPTVLPGGKGQVLEDASGAGRSKSFLPIPVSQSPSGISYWQKPDDKGEVCCAESRPQHQKTDHGRADWNERQELNKKHVHTLCLLTLTHTLLHIFKLSERKNLFILFSNKIQPSFIQMKTLLPSHQKEKT